MRGPGLLSSLLDFFPTNLIQSTVAPRFRETRTHQMRVEPLRLEGPSPLASPSSSASLFPSLAVADEKHARTSGRCSGALLPYAGRRRPQQASKWRRGARRRVDTAGRQRPADRAGGRGWWGGGGAPASAPVSAGTGTTGLFGIGKAPPHGLTLCLLCCGWWLVLVCCERKILLTGWWLLAGVSLM
ncbi:hypothetical protein PVAP13_3KG059827 [Panicum virgatum]|uniref:Uncharacterized protein n=1 Tax=Panicum virgatum TaxID=38727 RepID=A0A8T0URH4_PANVG|nr:hypothetical protein PVAP13_3KG059827 [Panicum virgatum]